MNWSKLSVLIVLGLGLALAGSAWLYRVELGDEALEFWGAPAAFRIRHAERVDAYRVEPQAGLPVDSQERILNVDGGSYRLVQQRDISSAPGISNARQALIEDASFAGFHFELQQQTRPRWRFALRFEDGVARSTLLFDENATHVRLAETSKTGSIRPISTGMRQFLEEQFTSGDP